MINEHDLADFERLPVVELYKVKPKSYIKLSWLPDDDENSIIFFDHLDGMYSFCLTAKNEVVHLHISSPVFPLKKNETEQVEAEMPVFSHDETRTK
jgi:hypothetical protein